MSETNLEDTPVAKFGATPFQGETPFRSHPGSTPRTPSGDLQRIAKIEVHQNRIVYVRNLPYKLTSEEYYDIFGKFGPVMEIRRGVKKETRGTCFVVYDDPKDAKLAFKALAGFNVSGRYLTVHYYDPVKHMERLEERKDQELFEEYKRQAETQRA